MKSEDETSSQSSGQERKSGDQLRSAADIPHADNKNKKYLQDLTRVPFSIWVFFLGFVIFRLFSLANDIQEDRDRFKTALGNACAIVEDASNDVVNLHKTVASETIDGIASLANNAVGVGVVALDALAGLTSELVVTLMKLSTNGIRCTGFAASTLAIEYYFDQRPQLESLANEPVNLVISPTNDLLDGVRSALIQAQQDIDVYLKNYNDVVKELQKYNIDLPPIVINLNANIPVVSTTPFTLPTQAEWMPPDFASLQNDLFHAVDPLDEIKKDLAKIKRYSVTSEQLVQQMGLEDELKKHNLQFCDKMNFESFDEQAHTLLVAVWTAAGLVCVLLGGLLAAEAAVVTYEHKKGSLRPSWCPKDGTLDTFVRHVWYKPSVTCLLVGLLGITIFKSLQLATLTAKEEFETHVIQELRNYSETQLAVINADLDALSYQFADLCNDQIDEMVNGFMDIRSKVNDTVNDILGLQTVANNFLNNELAGVDPVAGPALVNLVQCMASILTLPVVDIMDMIPDLSDLPRVPDRILTFNLTRAEGMVNKALGKASYPFDWYYAKLEEDVKFYYYMTAYGVPVFLFGLGYAIYDVTKNKKGKV